MKRVQHTIAATLLLTLCIATPTIAKNERQNTRGRNGSNQVEERTHTEGALLYCAEMTHNFGVVNRREGDQKHTFIIENRGDEPLVITQIVSSCSCMKSSISQRPILPHEKRELKLTYELKKMPIGTFSKSVVLHTTSRDGKPARFTLSGRSSYTPRKEN